MMELLGGKVIALGFLATIGTGLAMGLGALPVLFVKGISDRLLDAMLGFAAGVMLAATAFSLLVPAVELGGIWTALLGLAVGALFLEKGSPRTSAPCGRWWGARCGPSPPPA